MKRALVLGALLGLAGSVWPQPKLSTNEIVFKSGNWYVVRSYRASTNTVGCTAFYQDKRDVQLSPGQLIVRLKGDLKQVVVRFGDEVSLPARSPSKVETEMHAVVVSGELFEKMLASRKLALEITTKDERKAVVMRVQGAREALENIQAGCPSPDQPVVMCSEPLIERMRTNGVSAEQVAKICR